MQRACAETYEGSRMCNSAEYAETPDPSVLDAEGWIRPVLGSAGDGSMEVTSGLEAPAWYFTCAGYLLYSLPRNNGYRHLIVQPGGRFSFEFDRAGAVDFDRQVACCSP